MIVVLYGDADGRIGEGKRGVMTQASVPGSSVEAGDHFGWSVAADDVTGDSCADILVSSPNEDWEGHVNAGIAHLISFTPDRLGGPGTAKARVMDQGDVAGTVEAGDQLGYAVALSNYRGSDEALGAISAPGEDLRGVVDAGVVNTFSYLDAPYLAAQREQGRLTNRWLPGTPEAGDRFGASLIISPLQVTDGTDVGVEPMFVAGAPGDTVRTALRLSTMPAPSPRGTRSRDTSSRSPRTPQVCQELLRKGTSSAPASRSASPAPMPQLIVPS